MVIMSSWFFEGMQRVAIIVLTYTLSILFLGGVWVGTSLAFVLHSGPGAWAWWMYLKAYVAFCMGGYSEQGQGSEEVERCRYHGRYLFRFVNVDINPKRKSFTYIYSLPSFSKFPLFSRP